MSPALAPLDTATNPPSLEALRLKINCQTNIHGELQTRLGWIPLWSNTPLANNQLFNCDLHQQQPEAERARVCAVRPFVRPNGQRVLYAFLQPYPHQTTIPQPGIWRFEPTTGQWTPVTLPGGLSWTIARDKPSVAQSGDTFVYTDNVGKPFAVDIATGNASIIPSLTEGAGSSDIVTRARVAISHRQMVILMNLTVGGVDQPTRILWSDINRLYFGYDDLDGIAPVTGWQDLEYGDRIVNAAELGDQIIIYTERAIWSMRFMPTQAGIWAFRKLYDDPAGRRGTLRYPNTLVNDGKYHYYVSTDGIYRFNHLMNEPERVRWIDAASSLMFRENCSLRIDRLRPNDLVAEKIAGTDEIWISWPTVGSTDNTHTICLNTAAQTADYMESGFNCFGWWTSYDGSQTIPLGVTSSDNAIKHINVGYARKEYTPSKPWKPIAQNDRPVNKPYNCVVRGYLPTSPTTRTRLLGIRVQPGPVTRGPVNMVFHVGFSTNLFDLNDDLMTGTKPAGWTRTYFHQHTTVTLSNNTSPRELLHASLVLDGVFLYWQLEITGTSQPYMTDEHAVIGWIGWELVTVGFSGY